jgi:hypothetical protein
MPGKPTLAACVLSPLPFPAFIRLVSLRLRRILPLLR